MKEIIIKFRTPLLFHLVLWALFFTFIYPISSYAKGKDHEKDSSPGKTFEDPVKPDVFTINFNNVSIIEYIRFVSKITNINFVFDETDLDFNVTIISEEPISTKNIMSALIQVLRIHSLTLLEQENNLLITRNKSVNQISTVVSGDIPSDQMQNAAIVTRVFRIKNANLNSLASIIRPMISADALIEVSNETRQLIVTDITTNVDKIASLLASLDAPHTPLDIETYTAKNISPGLLVTLAQQILHPFTEGNPLIFVPQPDTNSIFLISTPYLIDRTLSVMEDLDTPSSKKDIAQKPISAENIFLYKIQQASGNELQSALSQIVSELKQSGAPPEALIYSLETVKWIKETNSLLFVGDAQTLAKVKELLATLDSSKTVEKSVESTFLIYKIQHTSGEQIETSLKEMTANLQDSTNPDLGLINALNSMKWIHKNNSLLFVGNASSLNKVKEILQNLDTSTTKGTFFIYKVEHANADQIEQSVKQLISNLQSMGTTDQDFIAALKSMQWIKESNSLIFTGTGPSLKRIEDLLPSFDVSPGESKAPISNQFWMYNPHYKTGEELVSSLKDIAKNLKASGLADPSFLNAIETLRWVPSTNSLLFTGDDASLDRIKLIVKSMDIPESKISKTNELFLYKPKYATKEQLESALRRLGNNLDQGNISDQNLYKIIQGMQWEDQGMSFLFKGDPNAIARLKELLVTLDNPEGLAGESYHTFFLYKLQGTSGHVVLDNLKKMAQDLSEKRLPNQALIQTIDNIKWIQENNSLLITGTPSSIEKVKELIAQFDLPGGLSAAPGKTSFFIYKPVHQQGQAILDSMTILAEDLQASGLIDPQLLQTISSMRYVKTTNSLLFTGTPDALDKVKDLLAQVDSTSGASTPIQHLGSLTFLIYKLQNASAPQFMSSLKSFAEQLDKNSAIDKDLTQTINSMKWVSETNSILFTGPEQALERVEDLAKKFDIPSLAAPRTGVQNFVVYAPKYQTGPELIAILCDFEQNLIQSGVQDQSLFDAINNLKWIEKTSSLLISGDDASIAKVQSLLQRFDVVTKGNEPVSPSIESIDNTSFLVYKLQYHQGADIQTALRQVAVDLTKGGPNQSLLDSINSLQWIKVTNSLLATGDQQVLTKLKDLIQNLDIPLRQVFIEVLIIETSLVNTQQFGVQWASQVQIDNRLALSTNNFPGSNPFASTNNIPTATGLGGIIPNVNAKTFPNANALPLNTGFDLGAVGDLIWHKGKSFANLGALVNALQLDSDITIVLNPKIITQDNNNSTIFVGQNIPYTGSTLTNQGGTNLAQANNIEYRDVGVNLSITPVLGNGDIVTMDISNDISAQIQNTNGGNASSGIQTSHTSLTTRVHVPNKHFVVLTGMIQDNKSHFRSAIPCLGGLPVVGAIFSENDRLNSKDNIIIFVRPQIINSFDEYKQVTEHQEDLYKDQAVIPILKEEFDAGVNVVKTPED